MALSKIPYYQLNLVYKRGKDSKSRFPQLKIFQDILNRSKEVKRSCAEWKDCDIKTILKYIITMDYFGSHHNERTFFKIVDKILSQAFGECIYKATLVQDFNFSVIPCLREVPVELKEKMLLKYNIFLLERIVKPIMKFFYKNYIDGRSREISFITREKSQKFQDKVLNLNVNCKYMEKANECHKFRGYLKFIPKDKCDTLSHRPIVILTQTEKNNAILGNLVKKINRMDQETKMYETSFYNGWKAFVKSIGRKTFIYTVKLDIQDAFGNVQIPILYDIIKTCPQHYLNQEEKNFIMNRILNQFVAVGNKKEIYKWNHGLLQGDRLSKGLHELFINYLESIYLKQFKKNNCFLHRTVDDYIFCSTQAIDVKKFEQIIKSLHIVNDRKTSCNVNHPETVHVSYCGVMIDLESKEISKEYAFEKGYQLRYRFKLWDFKKPIPLLQVRRFVENISEYSRNNNYFQKSVINTTFNTEETVLWNFFCGMCYVALKVDVAVMAVKSFITNTDLFSVIDQKIITYSRIISGKIRITRNVLYRGNIHVGLLKFVACKAFVAVLKKRSSMKYKSVIEKLNEKFNVRVAKGDLKTDFSQFNSLPSEFLVLCFHRPVHI